MALDAPVPGAVSHVVGTSPATTPGIPAGLTSTSWSVLHDTISLQGGATPASTTPSGWTLLDSFTAADGASNVRHSYYVRYGTYTAPTVAQAGGAGTEHHSRIFRIPGAKLSAVVAEVFTLGAQASPANSAAVMGPITGLTTPEDGCGVLVGAARVNDLNDGATISVETQQSGLVLVMLDSWGGGGGENHASALAFGVLATAGAVTAKSFLAAASASQKSIGQMAYVRPEPDAPTAPVVSAGADVANHPVGETFTRTATETSGGATVTARGWTIISGPGGVGNGNTSQTINLTNPQVGTYVLRYSATNSVGTSTDDMSLTVVTTPPTWVGDNEAPLLDQFFDTDYDQRAPNALARVTDVVRAGTTALRMTIVGTNDVNEQRVEVSPRTPDMVSGATWWLGFSTRLDAAFPDTPPSWQIIMQLHSETNEPPPVEISVTGGRYRLTGGRNTVFSQDMGPSARGFWTDWQMRVVFSANSAVGQVDVWRDGVQVVTAFKPPDGTIYDATINYWKFGIYRDEANPASVGAPAIVWHDHASLGPSQASLLVPPSQDQALTVGGVPTRRALGAPTVTRGDVAVAPAGIAPRRGVGSPTVTPGSVLLTPSGIAPRRAVGAPALTVDAVSVVPGGVPARSALGAPVVTPGAVALAPGGVAPPRALGSPVVTPGAAQLAPGGVAARRAVGNPTFTAGAVTVAPASIPGGRTVGAPTVTSSAPVLTPAGVGPVRALGAPNVTTGAVSLDPAGVAPRRAVGALAITAGTVTVAASSVGPRRAVGTATLSVGDVTVAPAGVAPRRALGAPALALNLTVGPVPARRTVGAPALTPGAVAVAPAGVPALRTVGSPVLAPGAVPVALAGVPAATALGTPAITPGAVALTPAGVTPRRAVGTPFVGSVILAPAVPARRALGGPTVTRGFVTLEPAGVEPRRAVGPAALTVGAATVEPGSAPPRRAVGAPTLMSGTVTVAPSGVPAPRAVGGPSVSPGLVLVEVIGASGRRALGVPELGVGDVGALVLGVPSRTALGTTVLTASAVDVLVVAVPSRAAVGDPDVVPGVVEVLVLGVPSPRGLGTPSVGSVLRPGGVPARASTGRPVLARAPRPSTSGLVPAHRRGDGPLAAHVPLGGLHAGRG